MTFPAHAVERIFLSKYDSAFASVRQKIGDSVGILCVIKANAYGLGVGEIAKRAVQNGAEYLAVAYLSEALELRALNLNAKILVFTEPEESEFQAFIDHKLTVTVYSVRRARGLIAACEASQTAVEVHIDVDTGMSRLGCDIEMVTELVQILSRSPHIRLTGIFSHFASSDVPDAPQNSIQLARFQSALNIAQSLHSFRWIHMANSAAITHFQNAHFTLVRLGIMAYIDIVQLESRVGLVRGVKAGESVSYNATYTCAQDTQIATIPIGYADGIPISGSNRIEVEINGNRYRQVGRVTMDSLMIDLGLNSGVSIGDRVIFFGPDAAITLTNFAHNCGTIPYEILCRIGSRVQRVYES